MPRPTRHNVVHPNNAAEEARWDDLFEDMTAAQWDAYSHYRATMSRPEAVVAVNCGHLLAKHRVGQ